MFRRTAAALLFRYFLTLDGYAIENVDEAFQPEST